MTVSRFCQYELRTTHVNAARSFYSDVLGHDLWGPDVSVVPLPERAAARGAPPHWLGHIGVQDVQATANRIVAGGGQLLGPLQPGAGGSLRAALRDPFGVVLGLSSEMIAARGVVAWHLMHTHDHQRAFAFYAELFDWTPTETIDRGPEMGKHQMFAWDPSQRPVGSVADTARQPHIHSHWMFFFRVDELEKAMDRVRAGGGMVVGSMQTASGDPVAPCDDPQGAAFALFQFRG